MVLLRVGAGGAWKLQPGSLEASKRGVWRLRFPRGSVGNRGVGNLRFIGLVGLGPASRVFTLLTATTKISICPYMTSFSNRTYLLLCEEDEIRQYLFPERSCRCSGDAAPRLRLFEQDRIGLYFIPERSWRGGASSPRFVGGVALRRVQSGPFSSDFINWLNVFSSTELGTGKIRTVPLLSLRLFPPHNALSLVTSFLSRNGRFYIAGPTS